MAPPKRTSRASSVASSAVSANGSATGSATPRRSARNAGAAPATSLPPVTSRESTSYGSGTAVIPLMLNENSLDATLEDHLSKLVQPARHDLHGRTNAGLGKFGLSSFSTEELG